MDQFYKLHRNSARCLLCFDHLISEHRHDYVTCSCGNLSVDGGTEYIRRVFENRPMVEDTSQYRRMTKEELLQQLRTEAIISHDSTPNKSRVDAIKLRLMEWYNYD